MASFTFQSSPETFLSFAFHFHPLFLFAGQFIVTSLIIGFSSPGSVLRPALLPLNVLCAYGIISSSGQYMRLHWASLLSGTTSGFVLQYIELALLSQWSFKHRRDTMSGFSQHQDTSRLVSGRDVLQRLYFGLSSTISFRNVNTVHEVKNVPQFSRGNVPSRLAFVCKQITIAFACVIIIDVSSSQPPPSNNTELFSPEKVRFLSRLDDMSFEELAIRIVSTTLYWANMFAIMQGVTSAVAAAAVSFGVSNVASWRPLFGSFSAASDLRGFWGIFWHQTLRQILSSPSSFLVQNLFRQRKGTLRARYLNLFFTFLISGLLHTFAELGGGLHIERSGTVHFFCLQAIGIMFEDAIKALFTRAVWTAYPLHLLYAVSVSPRRKVGDKRSLVHAKDVDTKTDQETLSWLTRLLGHTWVVCFLIWSTPVWLYPEAAGPLKKPFLPFSLVKNWTAHQEGF